MEKTIVLLSTFLVISGLSYGQSYSQSGGTVTRSSESYTASGTDESGVTVSNSGKLILSNSTVTTSGNTTSNDSSSFYGLNAGVLARSASIITLDSCKISTSGTGANGVFATGTGTSITLTGDTINCTNDGAHGVDATFGGILKLIDAVITTAGAHGAAISTDRGGGTVNVIGGVATASGQDSPGIYCTGNISATDATIVATGSEGAVIEGANTITLSNTSLTGAVGSRDRGVFIYQSMSGDASGTEGKFTMTGGTLTWPSASGPLIYVTNSTGIVNLNGVTINSNSPTLVKAGADQWGTTGSNGGNVVLTATQQSLVGNMVADKYSTINVTLQDNSSLSGAINMGDTAKSVELTIDATSTWNVTADSWVGTISDADAIVDDSVANIKGNGYSVYYDASVSANSSLGGKTYKLKNGGYLTCDANTSAIEEVSTNAKNLVCFPNPANDVITIKSGNSSEQNISIYNLYGVKIYQSKIAGNKTIDVSQFENGNYMVYSNGKTSHIIILH